MRHRKSGRHLNRDSAHRKAMFRNLAVSLIEHEMIRTTVPKAKELRRVAEPLITLAKNDTVANRRLAFRRTGSKAAVGKLFSELGPRYVDRAGGYTRIVRAGHRAGDAAPLAVMELVNRPDRSFDEEPIDEEPIEEQARAAVPQVAATAEVAAEEQAVAAEVEGAASEAEEAASEVEGAASEVEEAASEAEAAETAEDAAVESRETGAQDALESAEDREQEAGEKADSDDTARGRSLFGRLRGVLKKEP